MARPPASVFFFTECALTARLEVIEESGWLWKIPKNRFQSLEIPNPEYKHLIVQRVGGLYGLCVGRAQAVRGLCVGRWQGVHGLCVRRAWAVRRLCGVQCCFVAKVVFPEVGFHQGTLGGANSFPQGIPRGPFRGFPNAPWGTLHRGQGETSVDTLGDNHVGQSGGLFVGLFLAQLWGVIKT